MMMKKIACLFALAAVVGCSQAKTGEMTAEEKSQKELDSVMKVRQAEADQMKTAPLQNIQFVPPFRLLTTDSVYITQANLKKGQPVMFIYFSPDCNHCTDFLKDLAPHLKEFSGYQIIMATWIKLEAVKPFYAQFGYNAYKNIIMGTEKDDLLLQQYFQIKDTPYIALYSKEGKLIKAYSKAPKATELVAAAK